MELIKCFFIEPTKRFFRWFPSPLLLFFAGLAFLIRDYDFSEKLKSNPGKADFYTFLDSDVFWYLIVILLFFVLISDLIKYFDEPRIFSQSKEIENLKNKLGSFTDLVPVLFDGHVENIVKKGSFGDNISDVRATLYIHVSKSSTFVPCGRYSANPEWRKKGRPKYPDHEGCIGLGWQNGWFEKQDIPDGDMWYQYHKDTLGMKPKVIKSLKMKSRSFIVMRINDMADRQSAVIVLESTSANRFDANLIREFLDREVKQLSVLMSHLIDHIPNPDEASKAGF